MTRYICHENKKKKTLALTANLERCRVFPGYPRAKLRVGDVYAEREPSLACQLRAHGRQVVLVHARHDQADHAQAVGEYARGARPDARDARPRGRGGLRRLREDGAEEAGGGGAEAAGDGRRGGAEPLGVRRVGVLEVVRVNEFVDRVVDVFV